MAAMFSARAEGPRSTSRQGLLLDVLLWCRNNKVDHIIIPLAYFADSVWLSVPVGSAVAVISNT